MLVTWVKIYHEREQELTERNFPEDTSENRMLQETNLQLELKCKNLQN
jgi:hypothetical protein